MTFQSTVALQQGFGVPGEPFLDGPWRGKPGIIDSVGPNTVGFAFTQVAGSDGHCTVGGTIGNGTPFYGLLMNPKNYPGEGTSGGGTLAPTLNVNQNWVGEFADMGEIIVSLPGACQVGDAVDFVSATGALATRAPLASGTGSITTTVLTISAVAAGSAPFAVGQIVNSSTIQPGTEIISLGTGTGGVGTYNVSVSQTAASAAVTANSLPATGNQAIPRCTVSRYNLTGAGLGVIKITD